MTSTFYAELPEPVGDDASSHLHAKRLPAVALASTAGGQVALGSPLASSPIEEAFTPVFPPDGSAEPVSERLRRA